MARRMTRKVPMLNVLARLMPETINPDERTVEMVIATDKPARMGRWAGWDWEEFNEILSMDPAHVRMGRLEKGAPVLDTHWNWRLKDQLGVIEKAWLSNGELRGLVRFSRRAEVEPIFQDVKDGIVRNVSVGYRVHKYADETPNDDKIKTLRAVDWEPFEASLVPIPADPDAGVRGDAAHSKRAETIEMNECEIISQNETENEETTDAQRIGEETEMSLKKENTAGQGEAASVNVQEIERNAADRELNRVMEIRSSVRAAKLDEGFADQLIKDKVELDKARKMIFDKLAEGQAGTDVRNHVPQVEIVRDEVETRREAMTEALLHRFDPKNQLTERGRAYRSMSLLRLAEEIVGRSARGMSKTELAARALASADFPIITGNVAAHSLRQAYQGGGRTFMPFVQEGTLPDYKEMSRMQLGDFPNLSDVPEGAEYEFGTIGEGAEKIKVGKKGKKIRLTEEAIINDDTSAFTRLPAMAGSAAVRAERKAVYAILTGSHLMADGNELFDATNHKNLAGAGSTITAGLDAAIEALGSQTSVDGKETLNLEMACMIVGKKKEAEARRILSAEMLATKSADVNIYKGRFDLVVDAEISGNAWYIAASKTLVDLIELAYLEGMSGPQITTTFDDANDSIIYKVKHVFGVKAIDYRGFYKNPGA
jgi:hypothetical protein